MSISSVTVSFIFEANKNDSSSNLCMAVSLFFNGEIFDFLKTKFALN